MSVPMPIRRPLFTPTVGLSREKWIAENHEDLTEWFLLCDGDLRNQFEFLEFSEVQFDLTRDNDDRFREFLAEAIEGDAAYEDLKGREIDNDLGEDHGL